MIFCASPPFTRWTPHTCLIAVDQLSMSPQYLSSICLMILFTHATGKCEEASLLFTQMQRKGIRPGKVCLHFRYVSNKYYKWLVLFVEYIISYRHCPCLNLSWCSVLIYGNRIPSNPLSCFIQLKFQAANVSGPGQLWTC